MRKTNFAAVAVFFLVMFTASVYAKDTDPKDKEPKEPTRTGTDLLCLAQMLYMGMDVNTAMETCTYLWAVRTVNAPQTVKTSTVKSPTKG
jgi:hypothetical protein